MPCVPKATKYCIASCPDANPAPTTMPMKAKEIAIAFRIIKGSVVDGLGLVGEFGTFLVWFHVDHSSVLARCAASLLRMNAKTSSAYRRRCAPTLWPANWPVSMSFTT